MHSSNHVVAANFRDDPLVVTLLRHAIATVGAPLAELDNETHELLMHSYRERNGERISTAAYSVGKFQLDSHFAKFRSSFRKTLAACLQSQLDRFQGRESFWVTLDGDPPDLVPDTVIERRLAIDDLTRLIDIDASEGLRAFDGLLSQALGRPFKSIRDNPLRPAVFFHALGQCWAQASACSDDELLILGRIGPSLATRVASLYPQMTALLRSGLGVEKPSGNIFPAGDGRDGPLYSRIREGKAKLVAVNDPSSRENVVTQSSLKDSILESAYDTLEHVHRLFEDALLDNGLPRDVRLILARMQIPLAKAALFDPRLFSSPKHPLRNLLGDLMDSSHWTSSVRHGSDAQSLLTHLSMIAEMLKRERRDAQRDAMLYQHLHKQFLALVGKEPGTPKSSLDAIKVASSSARRTS